jgi:hypothetical protein
MFVPMVHGWSRVVLSKSLCLARMHLLARRQQAFSELFQSVLVAFPVGQLHWLQIWSNMKQNGNQGSHHRVTAQVLRERLSEVSSCEQFSSLLLLSLLYV